ncbi:hypothetical protein ACFVTY_24930 [Streptomyces sp. NPDC058067]|uniref:hypothetical protein n=1 Tax=Streptomyces sp. NPDC058067 TaxID=3346324 RepID=UPI0036E2CDC9
MATSLQRIVPFTAFLMLALTTSACDTPSPAPPVKPSESSSASQLPDDSAPSGSAAAGTIVGAAPADLHDVDWTKTPTPGAYCGVPKLVRFDAQGQATATSTVWGQVRLMRGPTVLYGDTDGDHRDEAAVYLGCDDNGATQNGQIAVAYAVYAHAGRNLALIGSITPGKKSTQYLTALVGLDFSSGRITAHEKWYRPNDSQCCPSGDATTVWYRHGDRLTEGATRITP